MRRAALPLLLLVLTAGCSGGRGGAAADRGSGVPAPTAAATPTGPPVSTFAAGPCRAMAPDVLALRADAPQLGDSPTPPEPVRARLKDEQGRIRKLQPGFAKDAAFSKVVQELVTAVGVARLASDTNTYKPSYAADVVRTADALVATCTGPAAAAPTPSS